MMNKIEHGTAGTTSRAESILIRPSGSWALWYQYMYACELLYGESVRNQLTLYYFTSVGDIKNFGRVLKDAFDILFVRCD